MQANILSDLLGPGFLWQGLVGLVGLAFSIWMFVDAVRRREWLWAAMIFFFSLFSAVLYYVMVNRQHSSTSGFELPGAHKRRRIKELEAQIHHLDKAHHHSQLADIYFQQGKLAKAEASYRAALERDPQDLDTRAHLGQCLLRLGRTAEARPLLAGVCAEQPRHDYGHTLMALAETHMAQNEPDAAIAVWRRVLENNSYARARVQLAELLIARGQTVEARAELQEALADEAHAPAFERRRARMWVSRARKLLRQTSG